MKIRRLRTWSELRDKSGSCSYEVARARVARLAPSDLKEALMTVQGCGCCVPSDALVYRYAILDRVAEILTGEVSE